MAPYGRSGQREWHDKYNGTSDTHACHYVSVKEMKHYGLSEDTVLVMSECGNYRNCHHFTNQSVHKRIDNALCSGNYDVWAVGTGNGRYKTSPYKANDDKGGYIPPIAQITRLGRKFEVYKKTYARTGDKDVYRAMEDIRHVVYTKMTGDDRYTLPAYLDEKPHAFIMPMEI